MSSLISPLLHRHRPQTADVAQAAMDSAKSFPSSLPWSSGQLPPPSTDEAVDPCSATSTVPNCASSVSRVDNCEPLHYAVKLQKEEEAEEPEEEGGILSRRKSGLVWNGSGFFPRNAEFGFGFQEMDYRRLSSDPKDELCRFRCSLFWLGLDQSTPFRIVVSWTAAFLLAIGISICYFAMVNTEDTHLTQGHPFDHVVHTSEAALTVVSFACLSHNLRKHGLRRFLFLDQISLESLEVQSGYIEELNKAFRLLQLIILPSFATELIHQIWWFTCAPITFPLIQSSAVKRTILCIAVMVSWLYKTTVFLLPCILFRLMCYLQNLRFEGYIKMLESVSEVSVILKQYMRLRQQLNIISHRYRMFIVLSLVTITASQFIFLLMITATTGSVSFFTAGNLGVCSLVQLIGFVICLHGAARITHRAQRIVSIVSQWHAMSTCQNYEVSRQDSEATNCTSICWVDEADRLTGAEYDDDLSSALNMYSTSSRATKNNLAAFHMRQAFVWYIQQDQAGISLFGYKLDRSFVYALASVELSLLLFILGLTIGID
eukprot:c12643_g1_i3 orf=744-2378(-)